MNAWRHYFGALEAMWHYKEMWLDVIFENEGEKGEDNESSDHGEKEVVVKLLIVSHNKRGRPFHFSQSTLIIPPKKVDKGNEKG
jgi:hypothetical protein